MMVKIRGKTDDNLTVKYRTMMVNDKVMVNLKEKVNLTVKENKVKMYKMVNIKQKVR